MNLKLKAKIIENYGSQYKFAHALGVREIEVSAFVRGHKSLSPEKRREWARLLKCKAKDLVTSEA